MVDVDARRVAPSRTVIRRDPVSGDDVAVDRVDLRQADAVALEHLISRIATVAVDVTPVLEEGSRVSRGPLPLDDDPLQYEERRPSVACASDGFDRRRSGS
jgi:hypothetical protein